MLAGPLPSGVVAISDQLDVAHNRLLRHVGKVVASVLLAMMDPPCDRAPHARG
jgi:hypothetical protein